MNTCPICREPVTGRAIYCSKTCKFKAQNIARRLPSIPCAICGQPTRHGRAIYCADCQLERKRLEVINRYAAKFGSRTERMLAIDAPLQTLSPQVKRLWNPNRHRHYTALVMELR